MNSNNIPELPKKTVNWLHLIHHRCLYWLTSVPQFFPQISNVSDYLQQTLSSYNQRSQTDVAQELVGTDANDIETIQQLVLNETNIENDFVTDTVFDAEISALQKVVNALFESYKDTVSVHVPVVIQKSLHKIKHAAIPWIRVEFFASLAYLWVRKYITTQALNLLLQSLHQLSYHPRCIDILRSGPRNAFDLLVYILNSTKNSRVYTSKVPEGEYDSVKKTQAAIAKSQSKDAFKIGAIEHNVVFTDPMGPWEIRGQSLNYQLYLRLLSTQQTYREEFYGEIYAKLQPSDFNKQPCSQIPFFRQIGQVCRQKNKKDPRFPLFIVPGIIVRCELDTPVNIDTNTNGNTNDNDDDIMSDDTSDSVDVDITTAGDTNGNNTVDHSNNDNENVKYYLSQ